MTYNGDMIVRISQSEFKRLQHLVELNPAWRTGLYFQAPNGLYYKTTSRGAAGARERIKFCQALRDSQKQESLFDIVETKA